MKKENGITMVVLVITLIILLVIMGVTFSVVIGDDGMVKRSAKASFEADINQIDELIKEKEDLYNLENVTKEGLLSSNIKQTILGEYYSSNDEDKKLDIACEIDDNNVVTMTLKYKTSAFKDWQIEILEKKGAMPM